MPPLSLLYTSATQTGWEAHLQDLTAAGLCTEEERELHISVLEMKVVQLTVDALKDRIVREDLVLMRDNTMVVAYLTPK